MCSGGKGKVILIGSLLFTSAHLSKSSEITVIKNSCLKKKTKNDNPGQLSNGKVRFSLGRR